MESPKLYTVTIFSENTVGLLNQVTAVFTRRQLNIETLSVSPSALAGIHKFTITAFSDKNAIEKVVLSIDKRVDVLKAYYSTDEELIHQEIAMYKLSTPEFLEQLSVEALIRKHNAIILEITKDIVVIEKTGHYAETQALFNELNEKIRVLQFIRSGRIAIMRSKTERLSDMLEEIEARRKKKEKKSPNK
jgi:acetolactate synthase-1/3 small subunit